jgi:hypothetical protein
MNPVNTNAEQMSNSDDPAFEQLASNAFSEFSDVIDYIWKAPRLIESEFKLELEKLKSYFPLTGDDEHDAQSRKYRKMRWQHEGKKLTGVFPYLMATGNLFIGIALFETYSLMLCKEIDKRSGDSLSDVRGSGISRLFNFLSQTGIDLKNVPLNKQANVAIRIRNCLFHASGLINWSQDESELRRIIATYAFLSTDDLERRKKLKDPSNIVAIIPGILGDQLQITNTYAYIATCYLRNHFCHLCKQAQLIYGGTKIDLPPEFIGG